MQSSDPDLPQVEYEDIVSGEGTLNKDLRDKEGGKTGIKFYAGDVLYGKLRPYLMNWLYPQFNGVAVGDFGSLGLQSVTVHFCIGWFKRTASKGLQMYLRALRCLAQIGI